MPKSAISVSDPRLRLYGRWDRRDPTRAVTVNTGSYLQARFRGRGLAARFDLSRNRAPIPNVAWQLDGGDWREAEIAAELPLAEGLYARDHTLMLMVRGLDEHQSRWSAPLVASVTLLGLSLTEGARLLDPPAASGLRLEFLGDSITEGVLSHPERPGKTAWTWRTDGRAGYACQTALALGAQWRQCGFGRLGVLIEGNGGVPPAARSFPWFYAGAPRDDWQPQGDRVGWIDGDDLFLDPAASYRVAQKMAGPTDGIPVSARTLAKRLSERGLLVTTEPPRLTVRPVGLCPSREG